jgi:nucleotide-binding universal stress UspA family protein
MPFPPKQILVATDFSRFAQEAADVGAGWAAAFGAQLTLLHVIPVTLYVDTAAHMVGPDFSAEDFKQKVQTRVQASGRQELQRLGAAASARFVSVDGPIAAEITRFAAEGNFDLVVVATHGQTGLARLAMGSVAEHVVRQCGVPVLAVRPPAVSAPPPGKA